MQKLDLYSANWSIKHVQKEGDTDLFPRPFEIDVITENTSQVLKYLESVDIGSYSWSGGRHALIPKDALSFRRAVQLDPLDSLVLTALTIQHGDKFEKKRVPISEETIFSYRFAPGEDGRLYSLNTNWSSFWKKSVERASVIGGWVVITDIGSYYNQISHHSVENQLSLAKAPKEVTSSFIKFLGTLTQGVSRGIPIGPHFIHLIAECTFDPIDRSMLSRGYTFCRYVDDIHIFCKTREDAQIALVDLADILDKQQTLTLQRHKTQIISAEKFIEYANRVYSEAPLTDLEKNIIQVIDHYSDGNRYQRISISDLSSEDKEILSQRNLEDLLNSYLVQEEPNFVRIRWLFRRLAQIGVSGAVPLTINKIDQLTPALADLGTYLLSTRENFGDWKNIGEDILHALKHPVIQHSEYLTVILLDLYGRLPDLNHVADIIQKYPTSTDMMKRKIVRAATALKADYWLREQKDTFLIADPWLRRALIAGSSTFGKDEREFWLQRTEKVATDLEKMVIRWVKAR